MSEDRRVINLSENSHKQTDDLEISESRPAKNGNNGKTRLIARTKDAPGLIYIERQIQDEAIVISGSLTIKFESADLNAYIAEKLEIAVREIKEHGGIVGHVKASVSTKSSCMISVTDEKAMMKDSNMRSAKITLAAILFKINPVDAENIIRKVLSEIRTRSKTDSNLASPG